MLIINRLAMCSTRGGSQGTYTMFASTMQKKNKGISGPNIGYMNVSDKGTSKQNLTYNRRRQSGEIWVKRLVYQLLGL